MKKYELKGGRSLTFKSCSIVGLKIDQKIPKIRWLQSSGKCLI